MKKSGMQPYPSWAEGTSQSASHQLVSQLAGSSVQFRILKIYSNLMEGFRIDLNTWLCIANMARVSCRKC